MEQKRKCFLHLSNICANQKLFDEEITQQIVEYANEKSLTIIQADIFRSKYRYDTLVFKIAVPKQQAKYAKSNTFWPEFVKCQEWDMRKDRLRRNHYTPSRSMMTGSIILTIMFRKDMGNPRAGIIGKMIFIETLISCDSNASPH